jgi:hypothetical protein
LAVLPLDAGRITAHLMDRRSPRQDEDPET